MSQVGSLKERIAEERRLEHERAQLQLQMQRGSAAIAELNGTKARPLVEIEEAMAETEAHFKKHSAYSSISLARKPKSFRFGPSLQTGPDMSVGANSNARMDEDEAQPRLKGREEQEYDGGKGQGNREEEEDEEEESNPTAFSTGPLPWSAPPNSPSRTVRMKTVRMSSSRGRTASFSRIRFSQGPAELDESDSNSGSGSDQEESQDKVQKKRSPPGWFKVGLVLPGRSEDEEEEEPFAEERRAARARSQAADAARERLRRSSTSSYMSAAVNNIRPVGGRSRGRRESTVHDVPDQHKLLSRLEQRFSIPSNSSAPLPTPLATSPQGLSSSTTYLTGSPSYRRGSGSDSTTTGAPPSVRMPNCKSAGQLPTYLLSPSGSLARSSASAATSAVTHVEGPTRRRPSSPSRRPRQASAGGALFSLHSSLTTAPSWATSHSGVPASGSAAGSGAASGAHGGLQSTQGSLGTANSMCSSAAGATQPYGYGDGGRKSQRRSVAVYGERRSGSSGGEPGEQGPESSSSPDQPDKPPVAGNQGGSLRPGRPAGMGGMMEAWGCNSGGVNDAPFLGTGVSGGLPPRARSTTAPAPTVTADAADDTAANAGTPAVVHTTKKSTGGRAAGEGAEVHALGAGSAIATVRARRRAAVSKGGGVDDDEDDGGDAASMDSSPRLGHSSPKGPLFSPVPPASEPGQASHRGGRHTMPAQLVVESSTTPDSQFSPSPSQQDLHGHAVAQLSQGSSNLPPRPSTLGSQSSTSPFQQGSHSSSLHDLTAYLPPKEGRPAVQPHPADASPIGDEPTPKSSGRLSQLQLSTQEDGPTGSTEDLMEADDWPGFLQSKQGSQAEHARGHVMPGGEASASAFEDRPLHCKRSLSSGLESPHASAHGPTRLSVNSSSRVSPSEHHAPQPLSPMAWRNHGGAISPNSAEVFGHAHGDAVGSHPQLGLPSSLRDSDYFGKQFGLSDPRLSAPMLKSSVADPGASPLNPPAKVISDDGTRRAEAPLQEALKPSLSVLTRPASALKPRSSSTAPYLLGSAFPAGASKRTGLSLDAPRSSVPNSSGSSPHTPSSPSMQEPQVQPSPPSSNNFGLGGPIRIQSSRSMRLKTKAGDEGCSKSADLAQQQSSPKAGAAGLALESARRRSALQASTAPLKATPHYQLTEPKVLSLSMSEPPSVSRKPSNVPIDQATEHPMVQPRTVSSSGASAEAPALASRLQLSKPHRGNVPEVGAARQPSKLGSRSSADEKAKPQPPPPQTSKQRSSSEPRQRSKLRKNSSTEPGGAPAANSARVGTKHVPARGKSILNIKAALGSAMASVLNPVMQTQRK